MVDIDADGTVALRLNFLLNFVEALLSKQAPERDEAKPDKTASATAESVSRRRFTCGCKQYNLVVQPTLPSALHRLQRVHAVTASVTIAVVRGMLLRPVANIGRCLIGRKRKRAGSGLVDKLRELINAQIAKLARDAESKQEGPGPLDAECIAACHQVCDAALKILEAELHRAHEHGLLSISSLVSAVLHAILRVPALNVEVGRQVGMLVELKGGRAGRLAASKVRGCVQAVLGQLRADFWPDGQRTSSRQPGDAPVTRLAQVVEVLVQQLIGFETLAPVRLWWRRVACVSVVVLLVVAGFSVMQCWITSHIVVVHVRQVMASLLVLFLLSNFVAYAFGFLRGLIADVAATLEAQVECTLIDLFEQPVVHAFVLDVLVTAVSELLRELGVLALPLRAAFHGLDKAGGVRALLAGVEAKWPDTARALLEGRPADGHGQARRSGVPGEKSGKTALGYVENGVDSAASLVNSAVEAAAAATVQAFYRGRRVRKPSGKVARGQETAGKDEGKDGRPDGSMRRATSAMSRSVSEASSSVRRAVSHTTETAVTLVQANIRGHLIRRRQCRTGAAVPIAAPAVAEAPRATADTQEADADAQDFRCEQLQPIACIKTCFRPPIEGT